MAVLALLAVDVRAQNQSPLVVVPPGRSVEMRVGERRGFSAVLAEPDAQYAWSLDGTASGQGSAFEFRPTPAYVGRHEVSVTALAGPIAARHTWSVSVEAVGAPKIVRAAPSMAVVRAPAAEPLRFELQVEPAALTDRVTVQWSIDGAPAGEGPFLAVRAPAKGAQRVRAVASSEYGGAVVREWRLVATAGAEAPVSAPDVPPDPELAEIVRRAKPEAATPATLPAPPKPPAPPKAARAAPVAPKPRPPAPPVEVARVAPPETPPPAPVTAPVVPTQPPGVSEDDVRALMFRYEQAWRTRNVAELRRIGHVDTDEQESALAKYFATTTDLEVAVHVLELHVDAGRGVVRFTRRDRFRDPAGREVTKESPPIEKTIVRTPTGVHFERRS